MTTTDETPVFQLKPLSKEGVEAAINKAEHYRLLNQPKLAESICLDVLEVDPNNQKTKIILLLALTDQFGQSASRAARQAMDLANSLEDEYSRVYYLGIVHERQGTAALNSTTPGTDFDAFEWYREAMEFFEKAATINKSSKEDPTLRWNTCARVIMQYNLKSRPLDDSPLLE
jgi:tetratricopeptide (TPR) repeat protein